MSISSPSPLLRKPVADRLQEIFLQNIRTGMWKPEQRIPPEIELARDHGACRSTVRRAIQELERAGLLSAVQGRGRIVNRETQSNGRMIGLISSGGGNDLGDGAGYHMAQGMLHRTGQEGDHLATFAFSGSAGAMGERLKTYRDLAGVALLGPAFPSEEIPILAQRIPVVALARDERAYGIPSFYIDYGYHALAATTHLLRKGHRHILVTHGKKTYFDRIGSNIEQGAESAYLLAGEDLTQLQLLNVDLSQRGGQELCRILEESGRTPTAIVSYGSWVISGFLEAARASGKWALDTMDFTALNFLEDESLSGRVSSFRCPYKKLAEDAASALYAKMQNQPGVPLHSPYRGEFLEANASR
ncbi:MAG TPA: GntR family transcriptional regulator [Terrimicrobiaceae bacterium]|nr:GntR family transcriptional regulator [Terrimicrobiaceae bacterium]